MSEFDDLEAPSAEEMIDMLQHEVEILTAQLDALDSGHRFDLLASEIRKRFGLQQRLEQEMARVIDLTRESNSYKRMAAHQRVLLAELAGLLGTHSEHDIVPRVRALLKAR